MALRPGSTQTRGLFCHSGSHRKNGALREGSRDLGDPFIVLHRMHYDRRVPYLKIKRPFGARGVETCHELGWPSVPESHQTRMWPSIVKPAQVTKKLCSVSLEQKAGENIAGIKQCPDRCRKAHRHRRRRNHQRVTVGCKIGDMNVLERKRHCLKEVDASELPVFAIVQPDQHFKKIAIGRKELPARGLAARDRAIWLPDNYVLHGFFECDDRFPGCRACWLGP